jgi:hypothetical protein
MGSDSRAGRLFEIGPDGYGYILDDSEPGRSYAFHVSMMRDPPLGFDRERALAWEGMHVRFSLVSGRPSGVQIASSARRRAGASL